MENSDFTFEQWYDIAIDVITNHGYDTLDEDAAREGYEEGISPEQYATDCIKEWEESK